MTLSHTLPRLTGSAFLGAAVLALGACTGMRTTTPAPWASAEQVVIVTTPTWDATSGVLQRFERVGDAGAWRAVGTAEPVAVGRTGSAWGIGLHPEPADGPRKREGDGRAPAGVFAIGTAFGYAASASTSMPYRAMTATDYCMDVPASPLYNRIVDAREVGAEAVKGSTEPMRLDLHSDGDPRYRLGFVIEHNPRAQPGAGSCIFAHLWRKAGEATAGCTAMAPPVMEQTLAWLDPRRKPIFVLLPRAEYDRLQGTWGLPALPAQG